MSWRPRLSYESSEAPVGVFVTGVKADLEDVAVAVLRSSWRGRIGLDSMVPRDRI